MLLCDDARPAQPNSRKVTVYGLTSTIHVGAGPFPVSYGFSVYLQLTEGRGQGVGRILVIHSESGEVCHEGQEHRLTFTADPLEVHAAVFRIACCEFPSRGLYWVEFWYDEELLAREPLLVR
jgi:hypothetical protein